MVDDVLMEAPVAETPLGDRDAVVIGDQLRIEERPLLGKITLRGNAEDSAFLAATQSVLGVALPTEPMTRATSAEGVQIFWKAFDEWLIWTPEGGEDTLVSALRDGLKSMAHAVVDVSDYYTVIRVSGPLSRELLAKGCALDLHPGNFAEGQATGTGFHHATIFITRVEGDVFDVMIRWSYADYLFTYFEDGAREWAA